MCCILQLIESAVVPRKEKDLKKVQSLGRIRTNSSPRRPISIKKKTICRCALNDFNMNNKDKIRLLMTSLVADFAQHPEGK